MTGEGHEDAFPRPRLSARCRFSQGTFPGTRGNDKVAPISAVRGAIIEPLRSTLLGPSFMSLGIRPVKLRTRAVTGGTADQRGEGAAEK
jgi:hypothetical protein